MVDLSPSKKSKYMTFKCYQIKDDHRNIGRIAFKSQWTISPQEELDIFCYGLINNWFGNNRNEIWSIHRSCNKEQSMINIGKDKNRKQNNKNKKLYIAKFTSDHNETWHGYPVAALADEEMPPQHIRNQWRDLGLISKRDLTNLNKGQLK